MKSNNIQINYALYRKAQNDTKNLINYKKRIFFSNKLTANIAKPKDLWKSLEELGLKIKKGQSITKIVLKKDDNSTSFDVKENTEGFRSFHENMAKILVQGCT